MDFHNSSGAWAAQHGTKTEDCSTLGGGVILDTTDQSGASLCACRLINVAHTGFDNLCLQFDAFPFVY